MAASDLWSVACSLRVPPLHLPEDRPYTASDFSRDRAASAASLWRLAAQLRCTPAAPSPPAALAETLLVVAERRRPEPPWSSPEEAAAAAELSAALLAAAGADSPAELLAAPAGELAVRRLAEQLTPAEWRRRPAAAACLPWLLELLDGPAAAARLAALLPPVLLLADDWEARHQRLAAGCLRRLLELVPRATLRQYGRAEVMCAALERLCAGRQPEVAAEAYPALLLALTAAQEPGGDDTPLVGAARLHRLTKQLLYSLSTESQPALRRLLLAQLEPLLARLGLEAVVWLRLALEVLTSLVETSVGGDWPLLEGVLRAVRRLAADARPRLAAHQPALAFLLCRVAYDLAAPDDEPPPAPLRALLVSVMTECSAAPGCDGLPGLCDGLTAAEHQLPEEFAAILGDAWAADRAADQARCGTTQR
ncbi:TELO2-interacting protein 2 [Amphibalanus amphitrite]|uniref:TELO2-interacting protein 2 n=1 Tax=Amphibalanus amphitrite TaxID=1232801 RepID=A0A6A4W0U5_AMPAM|nr:TELO2-interacting protein 2 [Amphibalanus amphitrite]